MATTTTYDLMFVGNPATNAARLKTLAHGGPLVVALDHRLTAMLPDAFHDATGGGKTVYMADLEQMVLDGMLIDSELAKKGVHFVVLPARYKATAFLRAVTLVRGRSYRAVCPLRPHPNKSRNV